MPDRAISVLLVEDNPGDRRLIEASLGQGHEARFDVMSVDRLSTALQRLSAGGVDVVLLDLGLPDSLGLDSFTSIHQRAPDVPVVVLSGLDHQGVAGEAVRAGAHHYLVKSRLLEERLDHIILNALDREQVKTELSKARLRDAEELSSAESRREEVCASIARARPDNRPFPPDPTLFALGADYRELALRYAESVRRSEERPAHEVGVMARRLARIGAGGHQVVLLHQRSLANVNGAMTDWRLVEDARLLLIDVLAQLTAEYSRPDDAQSYV